MDENKEVLIYELNFYVDETFAQFFIQERNKLVSSPVFAGLIAQSRLAGAYKDPHITKEMLEKITNGIALKAMMDVDFIKGLNKFEDNENVLNAKLVDEDGNEIEIPDNVINIFEYKFRNRGDDDVS